MKKKIERFFLKVQDKIVSIILFIIYFLILGPIAIYLKIVKHKKLPVDEFVNDSSWVDVSDRSPQPKDYLKQF